MIKCSVCSELSEAKVKMGRQMCLVAAARVVAAHQTSRKQSSVLGWQINMVRSQQEEQMITAKLAKNDFDLCRPYRAQYQGADGVRELHL